MKFYSQDGQDKFIVELLKNKRGGIFLDIGAYDGIEFSNSFYLEKELGWGGICVEPNPRVFDQLNKNRNSTCLNICIAKEKRDYNFLLISGYAVMLSGIIEFFDGRHMDRINKAIFDFGGDKEIISIPGLPLKDILFERGIGVIDYCNIDVEGGEISVLDSIDFSKVKIKIFTIENNNGSREVKNYLRKHGYRLIAKLGADEVYELNSKRYLLMFNYKLKNLKTRLSEKKSSLKKLIGE